MAKQKLGTRVDQLARWLHECYIGSAKENGVISQSWKNIRPIEKRHYRYVARQLIENPPACLTQQSPASVQQPAATEQQP